MAREFAEVMFTLSDLLVASYDRVADTYGSPVSISDGQLVVFEPQADTDELAGYGQDAALLTVTRRLNVQFKAGGIDFDALAIVTGSNNDSSGTTPNQVRTTDLRSGGAGLPYFGVIGVGEVDDGGQFVAGGRAVKLDAWPQVRFNGETNEFSVWEIAGRAIDTDTSAARRHPFRIRTYETASDFTAPTDGTEFKDFFQTNPAPL